MEDTPHPRMTSVPLHRYLGIAEGFAKGDLSRVTLLSGLSCGCLLGIAQKGLKVSSQGEFHFGFSEFEAPSLNSDRRLFTATIPTVIREPELAFNT